MIRVNTLGSVARVHDNSVNWNRTFVNFPRNTMSQQKFFTPTAKPNNTISMIVGRPLPGPTTIRSFD